MGRNSNLSSLVSFLVIFCLSIVNGDQHWNILNQKVKQKNGLMISLRNYCESWRMNVELNNIREFDVVPEECAAYVRKYMNSPQYKLDFERTIEECSGFIGASCSLKRDGKDAWIFDIDETLLSNLPYYKKHNYGGESLNLTSFEEWIRKAKAPALEHTLKFFNDLKVTGMQIILVSSRKEHLRSATIDNLLDVGYHGWSSLILRDTNDLNRDVQSYKAEVRNHLIKQDYRIWGILGHQWSSIKGLPSAKRTFKLPNPMYYA